MMADPERVNRNRQSLNIVLLTAIFLALLFAAANLKAKPEPAGDSELRLTPVFTSKMVKDATQAGNLFVDANPEGAAIMWETIAVLSPADVGVAGVGSGGELNYARIILAQAEVFHKRRAEADYEPASPAGIVSLENKMAVMAIFKRSSQSYDRKLLLRVVEKGRFAEEPLVADKVKLNDDGRIFLTREGPAQFSLLWGNDKGAWRRTFSVRRIDKHDRADNKEAISPQGPPVKVSGRQGLGAVDPQGNLYFRTIKTGPAGRRFAIDVTKTDRDGQVIFDRRPVAKDLISPWDGRVPPDAEVAAGSESFAVTWRAKRGSSATGTVHFYFRQMSAAGEPLGPATKFKEGNAEGGLRYKQTRGEAVIDDIYMSTRRQERPAIASVVVSRSELATLKEEKKPLFKELGPDDNKRLIRDVAGYADSLPVETPFPSFGLQDRRGDDINATISRTADGKLEFKLTDLDPDLLIDFYRDGRLIKSKNLGRGQDIALAASGSELVAAWTGGPGRPGLRTARWGL